MRWSSISDVTCALKQGWRNQISRYYSLDKQRIEDSRLTYAAVHYLRIWKYRYPRQSPVRGLKKSMKIKRKKKTWDERRQNSAQTYQYGFKKIISQDFLPRFEYFNLHSSMVFTHVVLNNTQPRWLYYIG